MRAIDEAEQTVALPDGFFEYLLQHIGQVPCVTTINVEKAVLTSDCCKLLQTALADPACTLGSLTFYCCRFADAHAPFPAHSPSVHSLNWIDAEMHGAVPAMDQMLPALVGWTKLEQLRLVKLEDLFNFAVITQMLLHNPHITILNLMCEAAPAPPGDPAYQPQHDPALLLDLLMNDKLALKQLTIRMLDAHNSPFNQHFLQHLSQCLMSNTSLELLNVPGIQMSTQAVQAQLNASLHANHSLIAVAPLESFGNQVPPPVRRNQRQRYWFTQDFVLGAAQAFLGLLKVPPEIVAVVGQHLVSTPAERAYSGPLMALLCKSTHQSAVKLRSVGLKEAALIYIRTNDQPRCVELLNALGHHPQLNLLPEDKQQVINYAKSRGRLDFLPPGYAH
ncbi:MAG: hypothetical protein V4794_21995 [Pseudomonadota bacterium]